MPILVAEDYMAMQNILCSLLKEFGFTDLTRALDGAEALEQAHDRSIRLVIADWHMKPMSGFELLKKMRATKPFQSVPFIMISGDAKADNILAAKEAGVNGFLIKPFTPTAFRAKLVSVIGKF